MENKIRIGLEIHCQLNTELKLFSASKNIFDENECKNNNVSSIDVGEPGTLPQINKEAIIKAKSLAYILCMTIPKVISFERKNYYYYDLPKSYQITQKDNPIGKNGYIYIKSEEKIKKIHINQIQLEEDTAKSFHYENEIGLDYNRSGIPLIEIITEPDFKNYEEVSDFLRILIFSLKSCNISNALLSKGNLRVDVNISAYNEDFSTNRTEIKNLNNFKNIKNTIKQEGELHFKFLKEKFSNEIVTKTFNEKLQKLVFLRKKMNSFEYYFIPEFNLPYINIEDIEVEKNLFNFPKVYLNLIKNNIPFQKMNILFKNKELFFILQEFNIYKEKFIDLWINYLLNYLLNFKKYKEKIIIIYKIIKNNGFPQNIIKNKKVIKKIINLFFNTNKKIEEIILNEHNNFITKEEIIKYIKIYYIKNRDKNKSKKTFVNDLFKNILMEYKDMNIDNILIFKTLNEYNF